MLLIPDTHVIGGTARNLAVIAGKQGKLYLVDRDMLSGFHADGDRVLQTLGITA